MDKNICTTHVVLCITYKKHIQTYIFTNIIKYMSHKQCCKNNVGSLHRHMKSMTSMQNT